MVSGARRPAAVVLLVMALGVTGVGLWFYYVALAGIDDGQATVGFMLAVPLVSVGITAGAWAASNLTGRFQFNLRTTMMNATGYQIVVLVLVVLASGIWGLLAGG